MTYHGTMTSDARESFSKMIVDLYPYNCVLEEGAISVDLYANDGATSTNTDSDMVGSYSCSFRAKSVAQRTQSVVAKAVMRGGRRFELTASYQVPL